MLALTVGLGIPAFAQDDDGGGFLERKLEELLSGEGRDVSITGFQGALSSTASLETMTFSDPDGVWLRLADVELSWTRTALLRGRLQVNRLTAAEIEFSRPPLPANEMPSAEAQGFSLPELPVSVNIGELSADRVILGEPLLGVPAELSVEGTLSLADGEGSGRIAAQRLDGADGKFVVEGNYSNATRVLSVNAAVSEGAGGLVATLAGIPGEPPLDLTIAGTGPLSDFLADLTLATDGVERVAGSLEVLASDAGDTEFRLDIAGDVAPLFFPDYQAFFGENLALLVDGTKRADGTLGIEELLLDAAQVSLSGTAEIGADGLPDVIDLTGRIASADGSPVLLPQGGPPIRIAGADLRVGFDTARSEDWTAVIDIQGLSRPGLEAEEIRLDGEGRIEGGTERHVSADLDFIASQLDLGDPNASAALGEDVSGRIVIDWRDGQPVEISTISLEGESYGLDGRATLATSDTGLDIDAAARVSARDLSVFSGLAGRDLAGSVEADITADAAPVAGLYDITLNATGSGLGTGIPEVDQLLAGDAVIDMAVRRDETGSHLDRLEANTDAARIEASASLTSERGEAEADVTLLDTTVIAPGVEGPLTLTLRADGPPDLWDIAASLEGPGSDVATEGTLDLRGDVPAVSGNVAATLDDLSPYAPRLGRDISGALELTAEGSLVTDLSRFDLQAALTSTDLAIGQTGVDDLLAGEVFTRVTASREGDTIRIPSFSTEGPEISAEVTDGAVDLAGPVPVVSGQIDAALDDIAPLGALASRELAGAVEFSANGTLATDLSRFDIEAAATTRDLVLGQTQVDQLLEGRATTSLTASREGDTVRLPAFQFRSPKLTADASGTLETGAELSEIRGGNASATVRLFSAEGVLPGMPVPLTAQIDADGTRNAVDFDLTVTGPSLDMTADARVDLAGDVPAVSGTARLDAKDIAPFSELAMRPLSGAIELDVEGSAELDLSAFDLAADARTQNLSIGQSDVDALLAGNGTATVRARRQGGVIEVERLDVETAALTLDASGTTGLESNDATFDLRLADVGRWVPGFSGEATASGTATQQRGNDWQIDVSATAPGGTLANVSGSAAPGFDRFDIGATGSLPLQIANSFIQPRALAGTAGFDLRLNGPPALESLSGRVETSGTRFSAPTLGIGLTDIGATANIANSRVSLDAGGAFRAGGRLAATGSIGLTPPFPADLNVTLNNAVFTDPTLYRTSVDGTVSVQGGLVNDARIGGVLNLGETEIRIPSGGVGGAAPAMDITHLNEPAAVRRTRERAGLVAKPGEQSDSGGGPAYPLDLTINAPRRIFVRGRGLDAELGGQLRLGGTTANVVPSGQFELVRGRLDLLGQRLIFDEGTATLQGDFNPYIRLVAESQREETLIRVIVDGPAASPEISFESDPDLPEDEVVARLLFGESIESLSPFQAAQLASAVATLAGKGGPGLVGNLRQRAGLDDLDLTSGDDGQVGVSAGKYLTDDIYSNVTVDSEGQADISLNFDLTDSFTVRGSVGTEGETGFGVFFERDY